jgi:hypothetical protein
VKGRHAARLARCALIVHPPAAVMVGSAVRDARSRGDGFAGGWGRNLPPLGQVAGKPFMNSLHLMVSEWLTALPEPQQSMFKVIPVLDSEGGLR